MESDSPPKQSARRRIAIDNPEFGFGNIESWANIIRSYRERHPEHQVILLYEGEPVHGTTYLFKLGKAVKRDAFELIVSAPDQNFKDLPKLFRLLADGAGPDYQRFLVRELHKVLHLF
jgi:hypothetical protein